MIETLSTVVLPIIEWLHLVYFVERPDSCRTNIISILGNQILYEKAAISDKSQPSSCQETSLMSQWPSFKPWRDQEQHPDFFTARISMATFGAFSGKPLILEGTWVGLRTLLKLHECIRPHCRDRHLLKLTKKQGNFQFLDLSWHMLFL